MSLPTFQEMWSRYLFNNKVPKIGDGLLDESLITLNELCWRNRTSKLGKLSILIGVYHGQENKNL